MTPAVVLLSGGQDSTTSLYWAKANGFGPIYALNIHYGQRHASEINAAKIIAAHAGAKYESVRLSVLEQLGDSALIGHASKIEASGGYVDEAMPGGLPTSFVPGRNIFFMTTAAAYAAKVGAKDIITGVCQTDYSGYPDCRRPFVDAMENALTLGLPSSCGPINIRTPLMSLTKAETVKLMRGYGEEAWWALGQTVTCYHGERPGCGQCPACLLRIAGFEEAGEEDPSR